MSEKKEAQEKIPENSEQKDDDDNNNNNNNNTASENEETQFNDIQKWLLENNLPTFLDKLLTIQNIKTLNDIHNADQDTIDTMMELMPQLPITNQLKKALYRSSDRIIMDEIESIFGKWRLATEENKKLKQLNELLIEEISKQNISIKKLQQQNAKLTKDVLQATLALTQVQLQLAKQGIIAHGPESNSAIGLGVESADQEEEEEENEDEEEQGGGEEEEEEEETTTAEVGVGINNDSNNNNNNNETVKQCDLCEIEYTQTICVSETCRHQLCVNCCKNSITADLSSSSMPECPVCRNSGNHTDIRGSSQSWKSILDQDIWAIYTTLSATSV